MKLKFRATGVEKLQRHLKNGYDLSDVKRAVRFHGAGLQTKMQQEAVFIHGYSTGTTKRNISLNITDSGFTAECGPTTEYAEYVEYGTRKMTAQPFVRPAFDVQKVQFIADLRKMFK